MNRLKWIGALMAICLLGATATFAAPQEGGDTYVQHDKRDWEDEGKYSLGLALGLISLDDPGQADDVEFYGTINFRIAVGPGHDRPGGWRGYIEPELGYWESGTGTAGQSSQSLGRSDMLLGLNIVGVMPFNAVDFFVGAGAGIHFIDQDIRRFTSTGSIDSSDSDEALGVNAHFGVDVGLSRKASLFGVGRFDIVDDTSNSLDAKAYLGLRLRFGGNRPDHWDPDDD